ncbi:MAG: UDPGP type 1 family protein [Phycisphaeraceae bacterium]|nr:UDPGP type 1 family protein [Phycisphaeraceae bacterium]
MPTPAPSLDALASKLRQIHQEHVLHFYATLSPQGQQRLLASIASIDLNRVEAWAGQHVLAKPVPATAARIEPAPCYPAPGKPGGDWDRAHYHAKGVGLIAAGKVAAFTVAGGQGTRLGSDAPKGCYPAGAVSGRSLFASLADWIIAAQRRYCKPGVVIPWYIMTSPINHQATVNFFAAHNYFGLGKQDVMFFPQGVLPSFEMQTGKLLLESPDALAVSPDGHGGSLKALAHSGALADMQRRGIAQISYTQIDNPLVRVIDPTFLGLHAFAPDSSGQMSSKMVPKAGPDEKVGVLCRVHGTHGPKTQVIEYSDMPKALTTATNPDGTLTFNAGSIAIHIISTAFLDSLARSHQGFALPLHRAEKKVPFIDLATGKRIEPDKPNAVKLEMFVFDALPMCDRSIVLETDRVEEFAPIKNATGPDSPQTCQQIQTSRAARWLSAAGHTVPTNSAGEPDCVLELPPTTALEPADLRGKHFTIPQGGKVVLT